MYLIRGMGWHNVYIGQFEEWGGAMYHTETRPDTYLGATTDRIVYRQREIIDFLIVYHTSVTLAADNKNPSVCPVRDSLQLVLRARRLNQLDDLPVCFYTNYYPSDIPSSARNWIGHC